MQDKKLEEKKEKQQKPKKVDECGNIIVDSHIKIFDPNSGEVLLDKRDM